MIPGNEKYRGKKTKRDAQVDLLRRLDRTLGDVRSLVDALGGLGVRVELKMQRRDADHKGHTVFVYNPDNVCIESARETDGNAAIEWGEGTTSYRDPARPGARRSAG